MFTTHLLHASILTLLGLTFTSSISPNHISCTLSHVHLSQVKLSFQLKMQLNNLAPNTTIITPTISTNTTCHWVIVEREDESVTFDSILTPSALQIQNGQNKNSQTQTDFGKLSGIDRISTVTGAASNFGQIMFVVVTTTASSTDRTIQTSAVERLAMPRRCRYTHNAVVTPARWSYKSNLTTNLADFGAASFPNAAPISLNQDVSAASLASRLYISGGTYDSGTSWVGMGGKWKSSNYWIDPIHTGRSWKYLPNGYETSSNMLMEPFPVNKQGLIPSGTTGTSSIPEPSLARTQRRLFGMEATMPDSNTRLLFHLGGINEIDGILKRVDVLHVSSSDGKDGYWDLLNKEWDLKIARHSVASASWKHPITNQIHLLVIGGNIENGATLNDVEMLILPTAEHLQKELIEVNPYQKFQTLNGTLMVPRSRASAVVHDNLLYVIGGELALLGEVERCNLLIGGCNEFHTIAPLRKPRYAGAAIFSNEMQEILYIGGFRVGQYCDYNQQCTDDAPNFVNLVAGPSTDVESYHVQTNSWNPKASLQVARYGLAVTEIVVPNLGYDNDGTVDEILQTQPMRHQIVALGGIGGLKWNSESPMTPRRLSSVEIFSCYQYSIGTSRFCFLNDYYILGLLVAMLLM